MVQGGDGLGLGTGYVEAEGGGIAEIVDRGWQSGKVSDEVIAGIHPPRELDLLVRTRSGNANRAVLGEALEQLDALSQHAVPRVNARVAETHFLAGSPLFEQDSRWVLASKKGRDGLFERSSEKHSSASRRDSGVGNGEGS